VIGPEKLPRVARTVGHLLGKAQRYVADVKAEVNRSIELEDLKKMKTEFEDAARNVHQTVSNEIHQTSAELENRGTTRPPPCRRSGRTKAVDAAVAARVQAPEEELAPEARRRRRSGTSSATACASRRSRARRGSRASGRRARRTSRPAS
jgi:Sec-independent protein translocase protein TatA